MKVLRSSGVLMFKRTYPLLVIALVLLAAAGCVSEEPEAPPEPAKEFRTFDESNDGETYTVPVGAGIRLTLPESPATGYVWELEVPPGISITDEVVGDSIDPETDLIGVPGTHVWYMEAQVPGTHTIQGEAARPWEREVAAETFTLTLIVE